MTQQAQADPPAGADVVDPARAAAHAARRQERRGGRRGGGRRVQAFVTALLLLVLFAGDLLVALRLPQDASTCTDRLCGPALGVAAGSVGAGLVAVVAWLVGDRRRERGRGTGLCWAALVPAALPWAFWALQLRWW